jgi:rare lipoprotein A
MKVTATCLLSGLVLTQGAFCAVGAQARSAGAQADPGFIESGEASWYGPRHEGRRTTSGEVFDSNKLTAAHPSLPLGSYVRVTVQSTGRSIVVRVNDREPPHGVRCIDLSHAAAARLGIVGRGIADVTLATASRQELAEELAEAPEDAAPVEAPARHRTITARHHHTHHHHHSHR